MSIILHVTKTGHKCRKPALITTPASYIKAGDILGLGDWELLANQNTNVYIICRQDLAGDYYEFTNFNCAAAKLVELGA